MSTTSKQRANLLALERSRPKVLVAIEPRVYREALGVAIRILRPHLEVVVVAPDYLGPEVRRLDAGVTISGQPDLASTNAKVAWVEYRPYDEEPAKVRLGDKYSEIEEMGLTQLLLVIDETERLATRIYSSAALHTPKCGLDKPALSGNGSRVDAPTTNGSRP